MRPVPHAHSAGKFKVEGNPYSPLDPEAQSFATVPGGRKLYAAFAKAVSRGRGFRSRSRSEMGWVKAGL